VKLFWTRLALADLQHVYDYVAEDKPSAAAGVVERVEKSAAMLLRHPQLGRSGRLPGTRELVVADTPFVVPYRVAGGRIEILAVLHASRRSDAL
jgi:toxin ParE1/3/4